MVYTAHGGPDQKQAEAQRALLARYGPAIQRYLLGALRDPTVADDAYQEFAVKFLRGDFRSASEEKGRFRNFLKVVLSRIVADHFRHQIRKPTQQMDSTIQVADDADSERREQEFVNVWRDELLTRAWSDLADEEGRTGKPWMQVLRLRVEHPEWQSADLANALAEKIGESVSPARLRVTLHRARERFSNFLISAVAETLRDSSLAAIEEELADLQLLQFCQSVLEQRKRQSKA